jgi:hypothetical protein
VADQADELRGVPGADEQADPRLAGDRVQDEVPVRGQVVHAGLAEQFRPDGARQVPGQEPGHLRGLLRVGLVPAGLLGDEPAGHVAGRLHRGLAVDREAVERRVVVVEDPDREPVRREGAQVRRGEVADLLLGEGERDLEPQAGGHRLGPRAGADGERPGLEDLAVGVHLDVVGEGHDLAGRRPVQEPHAECPRPGDMRRVDPPDVQDA